MFGKEDYEKELHMQQEAPEILSGSGSGRIPPAQDENFGSFIVNYAQNVQEPIPEQYGAAFLPVNETYGILYLPLEEIRDFYINSYTYNSLPKCYTLMDINSLNASGIPKLHDHPYLKLRGRQTAVAIIDTGISYENPLFRTSGGSRIAYLWDQTLPWSEEEQVPYGRLFTGEDIDRALLLENPREAVPSVDREGHGTAMAGIAAGNTDLTEGFSGAAPEATLLVVKLKPAKAYLRDFYQFSQDVPMFQEDDIMMAISYAERWARQLRMPLSVCLGMGSSQGAHLGTGYLTKYLDFMTGYTQVSVSAAAGNEGAARRHFHGRISKNENRSVAELRVGADAPGFSMELWGYSPESYEISIQSPGGEVQEVSAALGARTQDLSFVFVESRVDVNYVSMESHTGNLLVFFRFRNPAEGVWRILVGIKGGNEGEYHIWLPARGQISPEVYFLEASPYHTVTSPGDGKGSITVTAYQWRDNSLYLQAGRGYAPDGAVTPQLAAPGVELMAPGIGEGFETVSGTSLAAAQTAGAAALLFEWAQIRGNRPYFRGINVKNYLIRGAQREENMEYPNREWGYGRLNLYHTFELLS